MPVSGSHETELRRLEEAGLALAAHTADVIDEMAKMVLTEIGSPELIPLFNMITDEVKEGVLTGQLGQSSLAMLRSGYDNFEDDNHEESFFVHAGLPSDCDWPTFEKHYRTRGRIDFDRFVGDYVTFPPIAERIEELRAERLLIPVNDASKNKLKNGFD